MTGQRGALAGRLVRRLVDAGLVGIDDAFNGLVSVADLSRSNHVSLVAVGGVGRAVVKHAATAIDGVDPFAAEVAAYQWLTASSTTAALSPRLLGVLGDEHAIVTEPVAGARCLHEVLASSPGSGVDHQTALGRMLGHLHSSGPVDGQHLVPRRPWVLRIPDGHVPTMLVGNAGATAVIGATLSDRGLCEALREFDRAWAPRAPVHGDVKFDNVLVGPEAGGRLWLVDWELAGLGEPAWDLAGVADGLLLPDLIGHTGPPPDAKYLSLADVARIAISVLAGHGAVVPACLSPSPTLLALAVVARLTQTAIQLGAMDAETEDAGHAADRVLDAAGILAGTVGAGDVPPARRVLAGRP